LVKLGIAVASVVVVLIIGAVINNYIDVKAVETAIANLDWEAALEIDPDNSEGLRMQAAVKKAAAVTSALAEGDWIAVLSLDPDNREGLRMQAAAEKAAAVTSALAAGDWIAVLSLDPDNREGLRMQAAAKKAAAVTSALAAGDWIAVLSLDPDNSEGLRMQAAVKKAVAVSAALAKGDWKAVLAIDPNNREGLRLQVAEEKTAAENAVKVDAALAKGDWKTALALDADNREGLRLKDAAVTAALAKGDWTVVLSLDPNNSDGLRMQAAAEKAAILAGDPITNTILMTFNNIPSGTFMMGSPQTEKDRQDDEQQHKVRITKPFYMQTTEVTQGQWKALMDTEPWKGRGDVKEGANYPATWISRDNAVAYCEKLSEKERKRYRLPTEAEWEYACRARTETRWSFGNDENELGDYAWWLKNAIDQGEKYAHQVGLKKPNAFGLYDMHGNVWEWCQDYYGEDYYKQSTEKDPRGQPQGSLRVLRGGSWGGSASDARSAFRGRNEAGSHNLYDGFRLVRELD
jgi:sulfatase modifying factor 1